MVMSAMVMKMMMAVMMMETKIMMAIKMMMTMKMMTALMMLSAMKMMTDHIPSFGPSSLLHALHKDTLLDVSIPSDISPVVLGSGGLYQ